MYSNIIVRANLNFQQPFLQSSVSHDSSEVILICGFAAQEIFLIIINVENSCVANYFWLNHETYFLGLFDKY